MPNPVWEYLAAYLLFRFLRGLPRRRRRHSPGEIFPGRRFNRVKTTDARINLTTIRTERIQTHPLENSLTSWNKSEGGALSGGGACRFRPHVRIKSPGLAGPRNGRGRTYLVFNVRPGELPINDEMGKSRLKHGRLSSPSFRRPTNIISS
jgi:hypothetical protein